MKKLIKASDNLEQLKKKEEAKKKRELENEQNKKLRELGANIKVSSLVKLLAMKERLPSGEELQTENNIG